MYQLYSIRALLWALLLVPFWLRAELTVLVNSVPGNTPPGEVIYVSGSFNGWGAADPNMRLERIGSGKYQIKLPLSPGRVHFTFTRGNWGVAEGNSTGDYQVIHVVDYKGGSQTVEVNILTWRLSNQTAFNSDKKGTVAVLDDGFFMPQLNRTRRILVYLPPNYYTPAAVGKRYPVLYLQDGQTLFQKTSTQNEEWEVDESLDKLAAQGDFGCIVVGIENGGVHQMNEYSPWQNSVYGGGGQGADYMRFIVNTLKPFIDQHFRTNPDRGHTGIGGSGFGAIISLYGAIEYQHIFSKVLLFSPSFWFCDINLQNHISGKGKLNNLKMYFLAGGEEPSYVKQSMLNIINKLREMGFGNQEMAVEMAADGRATIPFWQKNYPTAYVWLFSGLATSSTNDSPSTAYSISVYPNPAVDWIRVRTTYGNEWLNVQIVGLDGSLKHDVQVYGEEAIPVYDLPTGAYFVRIRTEDAVQWQTTKFVKR